MSDDRLNVYGERILATALAGLDPDRRPDRAFVAFGPTYAYDCHQLGVAFTDLRLVQQTPIPTYAPSDQLTQEMIAPAVHQATYVVTLVLQCLPKPSVHPLTQVIEPPALADVGAAAEQVLTDSLDAWNAVVDAWETGTLLAELVDACGCLGMRVGELTPFGPSGDTAGARFKVTVTY